MNNTWTIKWTKVVQTVMKQRVNLEAICNVLRYFSDRERFMKKKEVLNWNILKLVYDDTQSTQENIIADNIWEW